MTKILLTWASGMLASDFLKYHSQDFEIFAFTKDKLDISNPEQIEKMITEINPDIVLNCAAYTAVDNAEDIWKMQNYDINTLWVYHLAKITNKYKIDFITFSTDYVFDGENSNWYNESNECNPTNQYGLSKYLWEKFALGENKNSIIIRTSWLYWWWTGFKNFVNAMLQLSETKNELKVVNDQFGLPTFTKDLCFATSEVIKGLNKNRWKIFHFTNTWEKTISWFDFAYKILTFKQKKISVIPCKSSEYQIKAKRPSYSFIKNNSEIQLRNWREWLKDYLNNL